MRNRGEAMMIYNVSLVQGTPYSTIWIQFSFADSLFTAVSQAEKRQEILDKTLSAEVNEQVRWIWAGMVVELEQ